MQDYLEYDDQNKKRFNNENAKRLDDNYIYKGFGDQSFIGFHFILSSQHEVLGEAPYMVAEINYKLWGIFYLILLLIGFLMILFLWVIKVYGSKKSK